jgi:chemotaxis protein MotA
VITLDISTVIGLVIGILAIFGSHVLEEGGEISALMGLMSPTAAIIVFGGTLAVTLVAFPMESFLALPKLIGQAFKNSPLNAATMIPQLVSLAEKARREGLLALEADPYNSQSFLGSHIQD